MSAPLHAQTDKPPAEGVVRPVGPIQDPDAASPLIGQIDVEFLTLRNVSLESIQSHIQVREGLPYSQTLVDRSIRSLYQTGRFDFIEVRTDPLPNNQVRLVFVVQPKYRIQSITYVGNDEYSTRRLKSKTETPAGQSLDERNIRKDRDALLKFYREKGFTKATIDYDIKRDGQTGLAEVKYVINEGPRLKIKVVKFIGNTEFSQRRLRKEMETRRRWFMSWLTGSGRFDETKFQEDLDKLRTLYQNNGYLDVNIAESNVSLEYPTAKTIAITIRIDEGRQYRMGNITFSGNKIYKTELLARVVRLLPGDVFSPEKLDKDLENLRDFHGIGGYLDCSIKAERKPNIESGAIDINYAIEEGGKFAVETIQIEGNTKTKSIVVLRELALAPGEVFNTVWMKNSEQRLKNTRFFEDVTLAPEATNIPGRRNLKVTVHEARTGQFQFGAGFSSLESAMVFFELSQGNFDLFNYRSLFQGDGQKFRLRLSVGSRSNEATIAFEEPWFLERRLALGVELYRRESNYSTQNYSEIRTGFEVYLRKRLIELWDGQLSYRLEQVNIGDVPINAPQVILDEAGTKIVSKIGFNMVRDTRNDLIFTTRGMRLQIGTEFAGVGGDVKYVKLESRDAFYIPTFELGDQVIIMLARVGSFWEYSDEKVPFWDRFFLGGPDTLRGFEYRAVGPTAYNGFYQEFVGGTSYGFGSLEYSIKLADPLRIAAFYDWGFVNRDNFDWDPSGYNDNWGFGIRLMVLGNPLRLDYGIPITSTVQDGIDNDQGGQFNFSFGTRF
ncbi:MAG: outer membrane protein assembly factor BamA [Verrucomicrobiota bacterium]|nr:outer membrane protein assembly factor BamA [Verrucomicrobiota bacterium]